MRGFNIRDKYQAYQGQTTDNFPHIISQRIAMKTAIRRTSQPTNAPKAAPVLVFVNFGRVRR